jgi:ketosteroid isomerase-like protein
MQTLIELYQGIGDPDALAAMLDDDVVCTDWTMPGRVLRGAHSVIEECFVSGSLGFDDAAEDIIETIASSDRLFIRATFTATFVGEYRGVAPHGRPVSYEIADSYEFREGRVVSIRCCADTLAVARELGALSADVAPW